MPTPMQSGRGNDYQRKRNGSLRPEGDVPASHSSGETSFGPLENGWPIPIRDISPNTDTGDDGFTVISPVAKYPPNSYGLYDMAGNVWQWTSDWYRPDYYRVVALAGEVTRNPKGPATSFDPLEPNQAKKVQRGGSYLCTDQYCSRYIVGTRAKGEVTTGTNHVGFRCVLQFERRQNSPSRQ